VLSLHSPTPPPEKKSAMFRGRGGSSSRGAPRGGGGFSRGGRGGGGAGRGFAPEEPPQSVVELGVFMHACEGEMVCKNSNEKVRAGSSRRGAALRHAKCAADAREERARGKARTRGGACSSKARRALHATTPSPAPQIPYFNAGVFLQNKTQIGRVDEIFGATTANMFTVKTIEGVVATSFAAGDKVFVDPYKLLPMARFTNPPPARGGGGGAGRGGPARGGFSRGAAGGGFRGRGGGAPFRGGAPARGGMVGRGGGFSRGGFSPRGRGA